MVYEEKGEVIVLLFWLQRSAINLTMSSQASAPQQRRTSQRRRLKLLSRNNEYRVPNPFKQSHSTPFPQSLFHQLRRIEFLSASAISQLCFESVSSEIECGENMLTRMHQAILLQQMRYSNLLTPAGLPQPHQDVDDQDEEKGQAEGEQVVQTKDEMVSLNIYDVRDPRREEGFVGELLCAEQSRGGGDCKQAEGAVVCEQEYENYFAN